jgi:hypothetical protein
MDKVGRFTRKHGRLRNRVWSNCYFIFHGSELDPSMVFNEKVDLVKKCYPFLFVRSYVYFVFVNASELNQRSFSSIAPPPITTKNYKIWLFNSKYEVIEETRRKNLFGITLDESEVLDDYIYLANPDAELARMEAANSDAIDCVRAFTGDLELLEQTSEMLERVYKELELNSNARIIVEGPARSGKTIIAATLLGEFGDSKFLLMNYFFYQAIVDGFHALSGLTEKEIETLVKNPELDLLISLKDAVPRLLGRIHNNLEYAIRECDVPRLGSVTKKWLMENISELVDGCEKLGIDQNDLFVLKSLRNLNSALNEKDFVDLDKNNLVRLRDVIDGLLSGKYEALKDVEAIMVRTIEELIRNSKQKFFHHNINRNISSKLEEGCWIKRGDPTRSKMWSENYQPKLIICDEVQRLGVIPPYGTYDKFDEVEQVLLHSTQSFFTGDDFQMLNSKYDEGIERIREEIEKHGQSLTRHSLPESVGVPAEIGVLMKFLTNPQAVAVGEVIENWGKERDFKIVFIERDVNRLIQLLDDDLSNKKHLASPLNYDWVGFGERIEIDTHYRSKPIIPLSDHEKEHFAYKFPYFCNEEIMVDYLLSAYELISREVESLYIHVPKFKNKQPKHDEWYRKHLYVLFTRPTARLVVNFDVKEDYDQMKKLVGSAKRRGAKLSVDFKDLEDSV